MLNKLFLWAADNMPYLIIAIACFLFISVVTYKFFWVELYPEQVIQPVGHDPPPILDVPSRPVEPP